jgi:hypothetical protein
VDPSEPYRLIEETAVRRWRRQITDVLFPALPPALALAAAAWTGVLPVEIVAASAIAFAVIGLHVAGLAPSSHDAARFLDGAIGAKDHFLTLATVDRRRPLMGIVFEETALIAGRAPQPSLPPWRKKPLLTSVALSAAGLFVLLSLPQLSSIASTGGELDRLAAELAAAGDADLAQAVRDASEALHDPNRSKDEKRAKVEEAIRKIDEAQRNSQQTGNRGGSQGGGKEGNQGEKQPGGRQGQGHGSGTQQGMAEQKQTGGNGSGKGDARDRAKQELSKQAGELSGETHQTKGGDKKEAQKKQESAGGGIQGPEPGKDRKSGDRDVAGNQPGKSPQQSGGNEKPGGSEGEVKAEKAGQQPQSGEQQRAGNTGEAAGEGSGQRPSAQPDGKPAERYYKPGEGPAGDVRDGQYVRVRIPEESKTLRGTEVVAKPGEVVPEVPVGNAPLPSAGSPGEVGSDQPVPLEYREALTSH